MTKYKKEIDEELKKIDRLIEESRREDVFMMARSKLRDLNAHDHSIKAMILVFHSKIVGTVEVPVTLD